MCGFVGAVSLDGSPLQADRLRAMTDAIAHRGPDDAGYLLARWRNGPSGRIQPYADPAFQNIRPDLPMFDAAGFGEADLILGHRRLSVIDLTTAGHQPMADPDGTTWLVYNGEIYNYLELRRELEGIGYSFTSHTDTEVVLHAWRQWGRDCVTRFNGMFALAVWDAEAGRLWLARDRYGVKPLYWTRSRGLLLFASEIKALLAHPAVNAEVDLLALNEYFSFQNTFTDRTLFEGVRLLPPGCDVLLDLDHPAFEPRRYWDFDFTAEESMSEAEWADRLSGAIETAVRRQCVADVPLGCYLSGGMDSGTITAIAAKQLGRICTFTGGFDLSEAAEHELAFDERETAEHMANLFQTEHYECVLHSGDMAAVMDELVWHLEDLRAGQCYPNYYVARLASKFVKVTLAGTGGDELFGGYPWRYAAAAGASHDDYIQNYYRYWKRLVSNRDKPRLFAPAVVEALRDMRDGDGVPFQSHTLGVFKGVFGHDIDAAAIADQVRWSLYFECKTFLHGLLVVEDKLSMAHSLESRVPFLDNDLVDLACRVPITLKVADLQGLESMDENIAGKKKRIYEWDHRGGKSILREAMRRILPEQVTRARKQGFSAPDESWFRGQAGQQARRILLDDGARCSQYLNRSFIEGVLDEHLAGKSNRRLLIWSFLSFEHWLRRFL